ncbi:type II toxin-antitoxin system RelE/ParE family toxin [Xenorhabdus bovienii]|uniref:type II toxin-antitoxin system RelE/ParE family toxin n=1 Tax=Xenorhabdus bovienii TaxID=40576 RepID=UPI002157A9B8|nr:type II toxin-antitoxin system RelE/ParE family toxin [Xenorhabdus bovienii]
MKVIWTPQALQDSEAIWEYLVTKNPVAAVKMDELFETAAERLIEFPYMGHAGEISGTFEVFPYENYRLVYEVSGESVWILALVHTSQLWPPVK